MRWSQACRWVVPLLGRAALAALGLLPATVLAQGTASLSGTATDAATHAPLQDVVVTATSPNLQGEQVVLTDATGSYRVSQLPPGTYTLRFELEGFLPLGRGEIELPADHMLRLNVELLPETAGSETITVVGRPPLVDVSSSQQGSVIDRDFIRTIPVAPPTSIAGNNRSFETLALTVPGARADIYGVSINGTTSPENSYLVDGVATRNPGFGISGSQLSVEFVEAVNVTTGAYLPEYGRTTGGVISATTRSGGNEFHGSVWGTWTPGALAGSPHPVTDLNNAITFRTDVHNIVDFGATLGGYIVRDRLWFFLGFQPEFSRYQVYRDLTPFEINPDGTRSPGPPIYTTSNFADEHQVQYFGKLTYLFNSDHRLSLSVKGTPSHSGGEGAYAFNSKAPGTPHAGVVGSPGAIFSRSFDGSFDAALKLSSSFAEKRVLLDVTAGWHHEDHDSVPADGSKIGSKSPDAIVNQPGVLWESRPLTAFEDLPPNVAADCLSDQRGGAQRCPVVYSTGGPGYLETARFDSLQAKAIVTLLFQGLGHHALKVGMDGEVSIYDHTQAFSGGGVVAENKALGDILVDYPQYGYLTGPDQVVTLPFVHSRTQTRLVGGFVQDSWSVLDRVTLNVGFRYDAQTLHRMNGAVGLAFPNEWSPRVGVVWDFTQQGRSKIYGNYARYYEDVPLRVADAAFGREPTVGSAFAPASGACNPRSRATSACTAPAKLQSGVSPPPNPSWFGGATEPNPVDPDLQPPTVDEWVAGVEYEVLPYTRASIAYNHRHIVRWVEDMTTIGGFGFFTGNPGERSGANFPPPKRILNSVTASVNKTFADLWLGQVSYTYQHLVGNIEGLFRTQTGQLNPNLLTDFDIQRLQVNRFGPLPGDVRHTIKVYLSKEFVVLPALSVTTGLAYVGTSGTPIDFLAANYVNHYGNGEVFVFPRGSGGRLPWQHTIDLNAALNFRVSASTSVTLSVNAFNLFNFQQVTAVSQDYTLYPQGASPVPNGNPATDRGKIVDDATGQPLKKDQINPNFWRPAQYQPVRQIRFQARLAF